MLKYAIVANDSAGNKIPLSNGNIEIITTQNTIETIISGHHFLMKKLGKGVFKLSVLYE
jgi:hypothetical protein